MIDLVIRQHIPGELMVAKVAFSHCNMVFTINRYLKVICFQEATMEHGYSGERDFNVAYIPYINEMMRMFYNAQH